MLEDLCNLDLPGVGGGIVAADELTDRQIAALRQAKVPDQHAELDRELADWKP